MRLLIQGGSLEVGHAKGLEARLPDDPDPASQPFLLTGALWFFPTAKSLRQIHLI
jgi:hypothetical protein